MWRWTLAYFVCTALWWHMQHMLALLIPLDRLLYSVLIMGSWLIVSGWLHLQHILLHLHFNHQVGSLCLFTFKPDTWVMNSGATHYMTGNSKLLLYFHSITPTSSHPVIFDDGSQTYHWYEEYTHKLISFPFNYSAFTSLTKTTYYLLTPWIRLSFLL